MAMARKTLLVCVCLVCVAGLAMVGSDASSFSSKDLAATWGGCSSVEYCVGTGPEECPMSVYGRQTETCWEFGAVFSNAGAACVYSGNCASDTDICESNSCGSWYDPCDKHCYESSLKQCGSFQAGICGTYGSTFGCWDDPQFDDPIDCGTYRTNTDDC